MDNKHYKEVYIPQIIRYGTFTGWVGIIMILAPLLVTTFIYEIVPAKETLTIALVAQISVNIVWWFIEPVSYFPILGIPGTYISFLTGNGSNLKMPCAAAAQKAAGVLPGTDEGSIISTLGICCSVFVNTTFLIIGVILGESVLSRLPENITDILTLLLPALFGAVFSQFAIEDIFSGVIAMILALGAFFIYREGWFNWIPVDPSIGTILVPIFGTVVAAKLYYSRKALK